MEFYNFKKDIGKSITTVDSNFILSKIVQTSSTASINCMHLPANGVIGYHQAVVPQLLLILNGEGYVRNEVEADIKLVAGDAVFWTKNEWHETKTNDGLTAIVIESEELSPSLFMPNSIR